MIKFDTHIHTLPFSPDSKQTITDVLNMQELLPYGIILTEHMDYDCPSNLVFEFDIKEYFQTYGHLRNDKLLLGVEMGLQEICLDKISQDIQNNPFDMVIGSIHTIGTDIAFSHFYEGKTKSEAFRIYFETMLDLVRKFPHFDTLAHLDYISRYCPYEDPEIYVEEYKELLTDIFDELITHDISLEINTRRLHQPACFQAAKVLYSLYAKRGGRYVTIGSDAHYPAALGTNFDKAEELIKMYQFVPVYYKNRKRIEA